MKIKKFTEVLAVAGVMLVTGASQHAYGQAEKIGNGGDVVICGDQVKMLDYVEGEKKGFQMEIPGNSLREKIDQFFVRFEKLENYESIRVKKYAYELLGALESKSTLIVYDDGVLYDVPDSMETSIPAGCRKEQLIIRDTPKISGDPEYTFQKTLWNKLDLNQQAMAITHEALYKNFNNGSSRFARSLNRYLNSTAAQTALSYDFYKYYSENAIRFSVGAGFGLINQLNIDLKFGPASFSENAIEAASKSGPYIDDKYVFVSANGQGASLISARVIVNKTTGNIRLSGALLMNFKYSFDVPPGPMGKVPKYAKFGGDKVYFYHQNNMGEGTAVQIDETGFAGIVTGNFKKVVLENGRVFKHVTKLSLDEKGSIVAAE